MPRLLAAFGLSLAFSTSALAYEAPPRDIDFKVYRDGDEIGHHRIHFTKSGDQTIADVDIELAVSFAGIRVFHYAHKSRETWQDNKLVAIQSSTDNDGDEMALNVQRDASGLEIKGTKFTGEAAGNLVPTSYWFADTIKQKQIIDSQNGRVFPVQIDQVGRETIQAAGSEIAATHYTLKEQLVMNLWYDDQGNWVKTSFDSDGSTIDYVLQPTQQRQAAVQ